MNNPDYFMVNQNMATEHFNPMVTSVERSDEGVRNYINNMEEDYRDSRASQEL